MIPKFRGKDIKTGAWIYGSLVIFDDHCMFIMPKHELASSLTFAQLFSVHALMVEPKTIGQYTGLKDKNGVKIYEGDVVLCTDRTINGDTVRIRAQVYRRKNGTWRIKGFDIDIPWKTSADKELFSNVKRCEVVGNIHNNPELLSEVE